MQGEHIIPFVLRLLSLSSIARVKRGAQSALKRFEEMKN